MSLPNPGHVDEVFGDSSVPVHDFFTGISGEFKSPLVICSGNSYFNSLPRTERPSDDSCIHRAHEDSCVSSTLFRPISVGDSKIAKKHVTFGLVDLYHFDRLQGFTCVPSQGGSTLGMANEHWNKERVSVFEHQNRRKYQRHSTLLRFCLEGKLLLSFQQFRMLESRVKFQQQLLTPKNAINHSCCSSPDFANECLSLPTECDVNPSDEDLNFLDSLEEYYFLQPLPVKRRRIMLRRAGLRKIDPTEKNECEAIRKSRSECGCTCLGGVCHPRACECALNGIPCQVDRASFPCVCQSSNHCSNPEGRIEFNPVRVRTHYLHTRMRLEAEERDGAAAVVDVSIPSKRPRLRQDFVLSDSNDSYAVKLFSDNIEEVQSFPLSSSATLESASFRSVEEALNATASNGGCRDCQDDRYVHLLLMQQLQCQQALQDSFETEEEVEQEGYGQEVAEQGVLSDNLTVVSASFPLEVNTEISSFEGGEFNQSGPQGHHAIGALNGVTQGIVPCDEGGRNDEEEENDDDDYGGAVDDECVVLPGECETGDLRQIAHHPPSGRPICQPSDGIYLKEKKLIPTLCRLEPIASLFHNHHEASDPGREAEREESTSAQPVPVNSRRPPSVCEVVIA